MQNLTDLTIKSLPPGTYWDSHTRGLGLRVGKNTRTFIVLVQSGRRKTLGRYPYLTLSFARKECAHIKAEAVLGKLHPTRVPFDTALQEYFEDCATRLRPRSQKNYKDYLTNYYRFGKRSLSDITTREIILALRPLSRSQREHAHRIGRTFFRWCVRHSLLERSPMENMPPVPLGRPRARVLTEVELRAVWKTARAGESPFHALVALLLLTGGRRGETVALRWDWIASDTITFPASITKNGRLHTIPYGKQVRALLERIPRIDGSPYVFPALRTRSPSTTTIAGFSKYKVCFDRECGTNGWTLHDLRRTYATNMARLGVPQVVVEKLLNHVSGGTLSPIARVYNVHQYESEMREAILAFERWLVAS